MFSHFTVSQLLFKIKALDEIHLPEYKGSTLRGGFGHALKNLSCTLKRQECTTCILRESCIYLYLFETPPPLDSEIMRLYPVAPHPFTIEPPENGPKIILQGGELDFGLTIIGRALHYLPHFIYAFKLLGETGLGRGKGKFSLEEVDANDASGFVSIYQKGKESLNRPKPYPAWSSLKARCEALNSREQLGIIFRTPMRIKFDGHLIDRPEFHHLIRSLLRRLSALSYFHCDKKLEADFKGLIERAYQVDRTSSDLKWHDWERYSNRQKQKMTLGGFVGEMTFAGDFDEFLPLLVWGEVLHIGKAASFGLGRYRITTNGSLPKTWSLHG